jgi:hypothetical protein
MSQQLYILDDDNQAIPVTWGKYDEWEARIKREDRSVLGKKLRVDTVGNTSVVTYFVSTPIGFFGRKPQLWITIASGSVNVERVYSSHRAAISRTPDTKLRELRKVPAIAPCSVDSQSA